MPLLRASKEIVEEVLTAGNIGTIRPNSVVPPFNNPKARAALQLLMDQKLYNEAIATEPAYAEECHALFVCGTPYATDIATAPWQQANIERAKQLLAEAGYRGEPIVLLDPADQADIHMLALITADQLRKAGVNVALQTMDWSTVLTRRNVKDPPATNPNGWHIAFTFWGGLSLASPISNAPLVSRCDGKNLYGWPCDETLHKLMSEDFLDAATPAAQMQVIEKIQARFYKPSPTSPPASSAARSRAAPTSPACRARNTRCSGTCSAPRGRLRPHGNPAYRRSAASSCANALANAADCASTASRAEAPDSGASAAKRCCSTTRVAAGFCATTVTPSAICACPVAGIVHSPVSSPSSTWSGSTRLPLAITALNSPLSASQPRTASSTACAGGAAHSS